MSGLPLQPLATLAQAQAPLSGWGVLALCVLGAVGLGLLLPALRGPLPRRVGGGLLALAGFVLVIVGLRYGTAHFNGQDHGGTGVNRPLSPSWWGSETGIYFWAFSIISIVSAVRVITHPRPVYSALYFVMTVFASAGLFVLLNAQFMAAALVLIYAGAVLVTYVFVIMLASESSGGAATASVTAGAEVDAVSRDPFLAGAVGFTLMAVLLMAVFDVESLRRIGSFNAPAGSEGVASAEMDSGERAAARVDLSQSAAFAEAPVVVGDTQLLGRYLYQDQMVAVQVAMLVLTLAMTGAVIIARRRIYVAGAAGPVPARMAMLSGPSAPTDDNPHSIPIYGTDNPRAKEYPQT